ncbi:MAG: hypothetical protein HC880_04470 [Bacteroidia bacterium]|nr:hypothetical protein [Bacteroidia bacterium]
MRNLEIVLQKDKVYEIAFASIKPDKKEQLFEEYFPKAGPIVGEYGGKVLLRLRYRLTMHKEGNSLNPIWW